MSARKRAVALKYNREQSKDSSQSPVVVAKGAGLIAEKILELALENDVYIHEDSDLVELLGKLDVGAEIPEELYEAVARVLALVYKMNSQKAGK